MLTLLFQPGFGQHQGKHDQCMPAYLLRARVFSAGDRVQVETMAVKLQTIEGRFNTTP
jgi:hypothetical protein